MKLRPYQVDAINQIRERFAAGEKRLLLHLVTGGGKTLIFCKIAKMAMASEKRVVIVVRGRKLVNQASSRLTAENIPHSVFMASHPEFHSQRLVQVCSIDTIRSRKLYPPADLVIIDEADQATSPDYHALAEHYSNARFLCVTATPYGTKSLKHVAETVIHPITIREIIDQGYLVDAKYYAPTQVDLSEVRVTAGEYNEGDLEKVMGRAQIVGDVVRCWLQYSKGRATLVFCVSVAHAEVLCEEFKREGVKALVLTAKDSDAIRDNAIEDLKTGQVEVICNVGVMSRGVDIPWLQTLCLARATRSLSLHLQQLGRGSRIYENKQHFMVLDHAGNLSRHGFMDDEHEVNLDGEKPKFISSDSVTTCDACFGVYQKKKHPDACPYCKHIQKKKNVFSIPEQVDGELTEIQRTKKADALWNAQQLFLEHEKLRAFLRPYFDELPRRKKADGSPYSPWWVFLQAKKQLVGFPEQMILDAFISEARKRGHSIAKNKS